LGYELKPLGL